MSPVKDQLHILPPGGVSLRGRLGKALEKSVNHRLKKVNYDHLVAPFRDRNERDGRWRCEFWGKIVRSAIRSWHAVPDPGLEQLIRKTVHDLCATQTPDGCISSYPAELQTKDWDIWGRKYALLGLCRYYREIERSEEVRHAVARCLDHLMTQVGPEAQRIVDCGHHTGLAASSLLGAVAAAARVTGEKRFLDYAKWIAAQGGSTEGDIFALARRGTAPAELGNGKAYEMTSCFEGLLELYRETGDPEQLDAVMKYFRAVRDRELFITGAGGLKDMWGEFWYEGRRNQTRSDAGSLGETCVTTTCIRFFGQILRLTGELSAADEMERALYNGILGAMVPDGSWWLHANPTPLAGSSFKKRAGDQIPGYGEDCCVAQGPEALATAACYAVMRTEEGPAVLFYEACEAKIPLADGSEAALSITGNYPDGATAAITVSLSAPRRFRLKLRVPAWSTRPRIRVAGEEIPARPGTFAEIDRLWTTGDRVELEFDLRFRAVPAPDGGALLAAMRGPVLFARDSRLGELDTPVSPEEIENAQEIPAEPEVARLCRLPDGSKLCDYASAGNRFTPENTLRVWLPKR
ncbi:beta-L-arabinofuranosidase domain-containing protein [uncultured Victivallis sp.]|uniref:beta-L-arabinofuranosidase domain-containing protein n=1 Tax=uncultured Victivallis sp. TaxID=354118 RepID=UPI0025F39A74|nr:beta-L-arabinofuranosidase domain-containing protein [uncultured Victivallis sp.]